MLIKSEITLEEYVSLYENYGMTLEINDGVVVTTHFEEGNDETKAL